MRQRERALKFRLFRLLKRRYYRGYDDAIREMANADPFAASREHRDRLLSFAGEHNRYYAGLLAKSRTFDDLPVLTKDVLRRNFDDLRSAPPPAAAFKNSSGGSTGRPVTLIQDAAYLSRAEATQEYYFREFLGVERNAVRNVWLWGSERDLSTARSWRTRVALFLQNRMWLNTFEVHERRWLEYAERIRSWRPHYVVGYAGSLYEMARVARRCNVRLHRPKFVYSSAEMLRGFMRKEIEEQFGARVYDFYGSREVGAIAGECRAGRRHVFIANNVVEIMDDAGRPVRDGVEGRIVVTNLHNYSMPLIRYDIGDTGAMRAERCGCGSPLPSLASLTGRITDHFVRQDGALVHGELFTHLFYFRDWIERFQVDQVDYDRVRISVVRRSEADGNDVAEIDARIRAAMGKDCKVEWRYVDGISKSPQGKHLFTRRLIDAGQARAPAARASTTSR